MNSHRFYNPRTLTRQYIRRINTPVPVPRRARWKNAWLGVSGATL